MIIRPYRAIRMMPFAVSAILSLATAATGFAQTGTLFVEGENVGIGTDTPTARLDILPSGTTDIELRLKNDAVNTDVMNIIQSGSSGRLFRIFEAPSGEGVFSVFNAAGAENLRFTGQAGGRLGIGCAGGIGADLVLNAAGGGNCGTGTESSINAGAMTFTVTSSRTIKENIVPVEVDDILERISKIDVYTYDFISGPHDNLGLMAEDFHQVFERGSDRLLNGQEVTMALWLAVRQLISRTDDLAQQNEELATQNADLRKELASLRP